MSSQVETETTFKDRIFEDFGYIRTNLTINKSSSFDYLDRKGVGVSGQLLTIL